MSLLSGKTYLDWDLPDPAGKDLAAVRPIRDAVRERVAELLETLQMGRREVD